MAARWENKRRFPRMSSANNLIVKKLGPDELDDFAKTKSIGLGGCMFVSDEPVEVGSQLELLLALEDQTIKTRGRVVYDIEKDEFEHEIGVEFVDVPVKDRQALEALFKKRR